MNTMVETGCTVSHEGRTFESGGSWLLRHQTTGKMHGMFYAYEKTGQVGTWHGDVKVAARFGRAWRDNFGGTRQHVTFTWDGIKMSGIYFKSGGDIVRAREVR